MRAAVYLRMSEDRTGEELGVERHREDCEALVRQRGWTLVKTYVDNDISATDKGGKTKRRPDYEALMASADARQIDRIVVWQSSRFWRSRRERADGIGRLQAARVSVIAVKGPELDMATAYGRGVAGLIGEFDTMEVEIKTERQIRENQQRAARGAPPGGRRAFGYGSDGMTVAPAEKRALRRAYKRLLAGGEAGTLSAIAAELNDAGLTTTMGGQWKHNAVRNMLQNPRYIARRSYRGEVVGDATWPALVEVDVWEAAQAILAGPDRRTNHVGSERKWLGSGLYLCGREGCGGVMRSTYREKYDDGRRKRIYRCQTCKLSRLAEPVDQFVNDVIRARLGRADLADVLTDPGAEESARARVTELKARRKALVGLLVDGVMTDAEVRTEAARLDGLIAEASSVSDTADDRRALAAILDAPDPVKAYDDSSAQTQADVIRGMAVVCLLPVHLGRRDFDTDSVSITPRI